MPRIFINYRREDTAGYAGRLYDRLATTYGRNEVFYDIESIGPGQDFRQAIEQVVRSGPVMVSLIGPRWLTATNKHGMRRLEDPDDPVRVEIETAGLNSVPVFPILLENTHMPRSQELPMSLRFLAFRNAIEVSSRFHPQIDRLVAAIDNEFGTFERVNPQLKRRTDEPIYNRVFYEPFDALELVSDEGRAIWLTTTHPTWRTTIADGRLQWFNDKGVNQTLQSRMRYLLGEVPAALGDAKIQVRVRIGPPNDANSGAGLMARYASDPERGYALLLQPGNSATVFERDGSSMRPLESGSVTPDDDGFASLEFTGYGPRLRALINGKTMTELDSRWLDGDPGLMAHSVGRFEFDDFALFRPVPSPGANPARPDS